jgi:hypothetical protein
MEEAESEQHTSLLFSNYEYSIETLSGTFLWVYLSIDLITVLLRNVTLTKMKRNNAYVFPLNHFRTFLILCRSKLECLSLSLIYTLV